MAQVQQRPIVELPDQARDRPVWARVGVIAAIGFVVGIAWPRLAGIRLGPVPPEEGRPAVMGSSSGSSSPVAPVVSSSAPLASAAASSASPTGAKVAISTGRVLSCRNAKGKAIEECDQPDFAAVSGPRLKALSKCPAAAGVQGKLSVGFELDFNRNRIRMVRGKSSTLPEPAASSIWNCLETEFQSARLDEVTHQHARYTIFYTAQFVAGGKAAEVDAEGQAEGTGEQDKPGGETAMGSGQVVYDTVLVRDEPKEGKVVARLVRGTRVQLLSRKGGWYRIRFGDREGWVYQGSIAQ